MEKATAKYKPYIIILIVVLLAELFVFNWRSLESMGYEPVELKGFTCGSGVWSLGDICLRVSNDGDKYIEFEDFDIEVKNLYIDIVNTRCMDASNYELGRPYDFDRVPVAVSLADEANREYIKMPERYIVNNVERTKYIKIHSYGKSNRLKLNLNGVENQEFVVKNVSFNKPVPFSFNPLRVLTLCFVAVLIYRLCGKSFYNEKYTLSYGQGWVILLVVLLNLTLVAVFINANPKFNNFQMEHHQQYKQLAEAFLDHRLYLEKEPPQALIDMENPYDKGLRDKIMAENHTGYQWDTAYYNGRYYVYFGALPALVYYLPYMQIVEEDFQTQWGVMINCWVYIIAAFAFMSVVVRKWFKDIPFIHYLLLSQVLVSASGIIFAIRKADLYAMPISMSMALVMVGLYFWVAADFCRTEVMKSVRLFVGSLAMASVAGCRPQFLMASFLAIPLFWKAVFKERTLFSKKSVAKSLAFAAPYVVVAAAVMWYNYARFGSVFDFGANYNLTTNDMTSRGFVLGRLPLGIFAYFLQPPVVCGKFPFIVGTNLSNQYMGVTIAEMMCGGIMATQPFLWLILYTKSCRDKLKKKGLLAFTLCAMIFSVVVACVDIEMAGILYRYYMDFSYLMIIGVVMVALALVEDGEHKMYRRVSMACLGSIAFSLLTTFIQADNSLDYANPDFYFNIASAIAFWM